MNDLDYVLQAQKIVRNYQTGEHLLEVLKGIDLNIIKGEMLGIVGVSGSGKSTLMHILGTLDKPTSGSLFFNNNDVFRMKEKELAKFRNSKIGFVFQFHHLLPEFTALENVMLPALISKKESLTATEEAENLLIKVGLKERIGHTPGKMSGGEQQRVALARALINNPDIVLADEPTGNLDRKTSEAIHELLRYLNKKSGQTFVIVTHKEQLVTKMNRVLRLADGEIVY